MAVNAYTYDLIGYLRRVEDSTTNILTNSLSTTATITQWHEGYTVLSTGILSLTIFSGTTAMTSASFIALHVKGETTTSSPTVKVQLNAQDTSTGIYVKGWYIAQVASVTSVVVNSASANAAIEYWIGN